jgi:microcystin-dependent protein
MGTPVTPAKSDIFEEDISYRSSVSEELLRKLAASVNAINHGGLFNLGDTRTSFLPQTQFQELYDTSWVLCDGSDVTLSDYGQYLLDQGLDTGTVFLPDMRGQVPIGINNGRSDGSQNTVNSSLGLGEHMADGLKSHEHFTVSSGLNNQPLGTDNYTEFRNTTVSTNADYTLLGTSTAANIGRSSIVGQSQNTVNSVGVNWFIKIWNTPP